MTSIDRAEALEQQHAVEALADWLAGTSFDKIATKQGCTRAQAMQRVQASMRLREQELDQLARYARTAIGERYELLIQAWAPRALGSDGQPKDLQAAKYLRDLLRDQTALYGAGPAQRIEMEVHQTTDQDREIADLLNAIEQNARADAARELTAAPPTVNAENPGE